MGVKDICLYPTAIKMINQALNIKSVIYEKEFKLLSTEELRKLIQGIYSVIPML